MNVKNVLTWNYKKVDAFFRRASDNEKREYLKALPCSPVLDYRSLTFDFDCIISQKSFILLDGISGTGKSTLAKKIKQRYKDDVEIVDIDLVLLSYLYEQRNKLSALQFIKFFQNFDYESEIYIANNLEQIIKQASQKRTRSVILVGSYLYPIARCVVTFNLGMKLFPYTVGITLHENFDVIKKRLSDRDGRLTGDSLNRITSNFNYLDDMLNNTVEALGIGMNLSIIANSETIWWNN